MCLDVLILEIVLAGGSFCWVSWRKASRRQIEKNVHVVLMFDETRFLTDDVAHPCCHGERERRRFRTA